MMRQEKGKSSIKLIFAIIVIAVVVGLGVKYTLDFINKEKVKNLQADLLLVKAKIEICKGNYDMNKDENPLQGFQLTQLPENIDIKEFLEKRVIPEEEYEKYYLLDSDALGKIGLQDLVNRYSGYFIVNYENYEVVYSEGYENENGIWCYKVSDINKLPENHNTQIVKNKTNEENNNEENNNGENEQTAQTEENSQTDDKKE